MKTLQLKTQRRAKGFSLVELLAVVAVIGILAAIIVPNLSSNNLAAEHAVARRNAQAISSLNAQAIAIGAPELRGVSDPVTIIDKLMAGVRGSGALSDLTVQLGQMSPSDITKARAFLVQRDGILTTTETAN
jgi:type IV pilus assembly protein PilA